MRRLKAIYLVPVFIVLMVGLGFAAYFLQLAPLMEKVKTARTNWEKERTAAKTAEPEYDKALDEQIASANQIYKGYWQFHQIQNRMPAIYNMKEMYTGKEKEGLVRWYTIMGTGQMIKEINTWSKKFQLSNSNVDLKIDAKQPMGYAETLPGAKMVLVDFGDQSAYSNGYAGLVHKIQKLTGYSYYPLLIAGEGGQPKFTIAVHRQSLRHRPQTPMLSMKYSAKSYFLTRGWDPNGAGAKAELEKLNPILIDAEAWKLDQKIPERTDWTLPSKSADKKIPGENHGPCPPVLWFIQQQGVEL